MRGRRLSQAGSSAAQSRRRESSSGDGAAAEKSVLSVEVMFGEARVVGRWEVRSGQAEQAATQRTSAGLEHEPGPLNTAGVCHLRRQRASSAVKAKGQRANAGAVGSARRWGRRC